MANALLIGLGAIIASAVGYTFAQRWWFRTEIIRAVRIIRAEPGDVVFVTVGDGVAPEMLAAIADDMRERLTQAAMGHVSVVVSKGRTGVQVFRPGIPGELLS